MNATAEATGVGRMLRRWRTERRISQLDLAIAAPHLTDVQRKRFIARREEIRNALREQRGDRGNHGPPPG